MTRPNESGRGGMTGATGDLTPDDSDHPFEPAELREISDPEHQAEVTTAQGRHAPGQHGAPGAVPGSGGEGAAPRDAGYGSEHGLSSGDPAYRMESRPEEPHERRRAEGDTDEHSDQEEHF